MNERLRLACLAGDEARRYLDWLRAVKENPQDEQAWNMMTTVVPDLAGALSEFTNHLDDEKQEGIITMDEQNKPIISVANYGSSICNGCGSFTPDGESTGNLNIKHFTLHNGNSRTIITYCNECAAKIAFFLLEAWGEIGE